MSSNEVRDLVPLDRLPTKVLLKQLADDGEEILRYQLRIVKAELKEEAEKAATGVALLAGSAALGTGALFCVAIASVLLLGKEMEMWVAAFVVGGAFAVLGGLAAFTGLKMLRSVDPTPNEAIESLKEEAECAKQTLRDMQLQREEAT